MSAARGTSSSGGALVIVESPTKQRMIAGFLGKNFVVKSSMGHIRDLPQRDLGVDLEKNFEPQYVVIEKKTKVISELKSASRGAKEIFLATDYDREGEAIAWHLVETLKLPASKIKRVVFHEITKDAIKEAIGHPRGLDLNLVSAQQARRVLDRLVGYKLSPLLWAKVRRGLSAGRVQSVTVRLIVEREKEIDQFARETYWSIHGIFEKNGATFSSELVEWQGSVVGETRTHQLFAQTYKVQSTIFKDDASAQAATARLRQLPLRISKLDEADRKRSPAAPFTTSTMTQAASQALGFSAQRTMRVAQGLYENGFITYMRTDSVNVARSAQEQARDFIAKNFGKNYYPAQIPVYKTKTKGAQEAHEAIRPTSVYQDKDALAYKMARDQGGKDHGALYDLIWRRFLASQMEDALYHVMTVEIADAGGQAKFRATGRRLVFDGFLRLYEDYQEGEGDEPSSLPALKEGESLALAGVPNALEARSHETSSPPRYNEASLVRTLEEHGIGRPSTYAPTLATVVDRGYVYLKERRFYPNEIGKVVIEQLKGHFPDVVDLSFTAQMEEDLDLIAEGERPWQKVIEAFYKPFDKEIQKAQKAMGKVSVVPKDSGHKCRRCGGVMLLKEGRFGKYLMCENNPETCTNKMSLDTEGNPLEPEVTQEKCPKCGKLMFKKRGLRGLFYLACQDYPKCKTSISLDRQGNKVIRPAPEITEFKCEKCGKFLLKRVGPRGPFLACSGFPKCRNTKSLPK
ncbi:MAG: type I DNA topoisomerase [Elusimicrobia bacterium]|nr:type I DNA topoisomerase [Elusimicrobiota bacterium]